MPPEPGEDVIRAVLAKDGLPCQAEIERVVLDEAVNYTRLVGAVCVKLLKDEELLEDVYTEVIAAQAAFRTGVGDAPPG